MKEISLYIHVPFCKIKCNYCAFFTMSGRESKLPEYFSSLKKEVDLISNQLDNTIITTIFLGGGTPSLVDSREVKNLLEHIYSKLKIFKNAEVTIECNPESITKSKIDEYLNSKINRISIGLQAWQNRILKYLNRLYTIDEFVDKYTIVKNSGFKNINIDLIFGIPEQSIDEWKETVINTVRLDPTHISAYSLELDEDSTLGRMYLRKKLNPLDQNIDRKMYDFVKKYLEQNDYEHYEISNFSKTGFRCIHNLNFWKYYEYIGIGAGAHSFFNQKRYYNIKSIENYIKQINSNRIPSVQIENIEPSKSHIEFFITNIRLIGGFEIKSFLERFNINLEDRFRNEIKKLRVEGYLKLEKGRIFLTKKGMNLENLVIQSFL